MRRLCVGLFLFFAVIIAVKADAQRVFGDFLTKMDVEYIQPANEMYGEAELLFEYAVSVADAARIIRNENVESWPDERKKRFTEASNYEEMVWSEVRHRRTIADDKYDAYMAIVAKCAADFQAAAQNSDGPGMEAAYNELTTEGFSAANNYWDACYNFWVAAAGHVVAAEALMEIAQE